MKIIIRAGGVLRSGSERDLVDDYIKRANGLSARCGIHSVSEQQVDLKKCKTRHAETEKLLQGLPKTAHIICLDERGKSPASRQISKTIMTQQSQGTDLYVLLIGGADGFEPSLLPKNIIKWSFGQQTWPHKLVRVMAAEQMYRALSILAGTPYHRD